MAIKFRSRFRTSLKPLIPYLSLLLVPTACVFPVNARAVGVAYYGCARCLYGGSCAAYPENALRHEEILAYHPTYCVDYDHRPPGPCASFVVKSYEIWAKDRDGNWFKTSDTCTTVHCDEGTPILSRPCTRPWFSTPISTVPIGSNPTTAEREGLGCSAH